MKKYLILIILLFVQLYSQEKNTETNIIEPKLNKPKKKLIILSIDGFPGYYQESGSKFYHLTPNLNKLRKLSNFNTKVFPIYPTSTYPSHTSMITGTNPIDHGIHYNVYIDPFYRYRGAWNWFSDEIQTKTILDFASKHDFRVGSVYWPVSVGFDIDYNIPQYWRLKNEDDEKIIRALSTRTLYDDIKNEIQMPVIETSGDVSRFKAAAAMWKLKKPDLMLVYTTDLDTIHHSFKGGVYSNLAKQTLITIDKLLGEFIESVKLYETQELGMIVVSDHGFKKVQSQCAPNKVLINQNYISPSKGRWGYYFRTTGGTAFLVANEKMESKFPKLKLSKIKSALERACPGVVFDYNDKYAKQVRKFMDKNILGIAYTSKGIAFSDTINPRTRTFSHTAPYWQHGFMPQDSDMKPIGLFYPKSANLKINKLTDVFHVGCEWLEIDCK